MASMPDSQNATERDYHLLGLKPGAPQEAVKRAYRELAKQWHPDRFAQDTPMARAEAEERFKRLQEAYRRVLEHPLESHASVHPSSHGHSGADGKTRGGETSRTERRSEPGGKAPGRQRAGTTADRRRGSLLQRLLGGQGSATARRAAVAAVLCAVAFALWYGRPGIHPVKAPPSSTRQAVRTPATPPRGPLSTSTSGLAKKLDDAAKRQRDIVQAPARLPQDHARKDREKTPPRASFSLGSTQEEVLRVQGPPEKKYGNRWIYGLSEVRFRENRVTGYDNFDGRLRVSLRPSRQQTTDGTRPFFTLGSTKDEVLRVQGTPTSVRGDRWTYGFSEVRFEDGRVVSYDNYFGNLKIRLLPSPDAVAAGSGSSGYFTIGSTPDQVLAVQGTPTSIRGNLWFYQFADVLFRNGRVRWVNDPDGRLRFMPLEALSQRRGREP
ncbi:DnaJ domain-containing protein [Desulfacinum hydrothermale DSM 13146]|uniref:DnaJ domain-containing protein n=1 Tax=Desulfacinum hydrothermale DSM 13146 TaxID=1121390 RepID=A0A1W1XES6_9BACT|nr:DnaJ domain-containing protein [Desulfacinum hydrothermale]SMC22429.1 DnaJ domain-containing protein [Desulfacinum hydrothermale DSM 13146]